MMKMKRYAVISGLVCLCLLITACQSGNEAPDSDRLLNERLEAEKENTLPGSFAIPDGWVQAAQYSSDEKTFYVEAGHEEDTQPDNISINAGTNRYSADDHLSFREAIVRQLASQMSDQTDAMIYGDGAETEQGYPVYIFTIDEKSAGMVTKQYYIVGDYRYCLIHLTNFTGSEAADEAAKAMADSFIWDSEDGKE